METDPVSETRFWENIAEWTKSKNMILSSAVHHRQNPVELNGKTCQVILIVVLFNPIYPLHSMNLKWSYHYLQTELTV
jgi:hypothetical protein